MNSHALWSILEEHPLAGWLHPASQPLPWVNRDGRMLWCGIGGSWASAQALVSALSPPEVLARWVPLVSPEPMPLELGPDDQIVFASKSGRTLELWTWIGRLRSLPGWGDWHRPPVVITQDDANPLAQWAREEGWPMLRIPEAVGGRYSAFSPIGTLPLQWFHQDPQVFLRAGAEAVQEARARQGKWGTLVWETFDRLLEAHRSGIHIWAFLTYSARLAALGTWWAQLVAESLGKTTAHGLRVGLTPLQALGPQDQHSQLQRWIGGPKNLGVILTTWASHEPELPLNLPSVCPYRGLEARTPLQVLEAQARGTQAALLSAGVPLIHWHLEHGLTLETAGSLMMSWQLTVALLGLALGVDPFDQPAVEAGKRSTETLLHVAGEAPAW